MNPTCSSPVRSALLVAALVACTPIVGVRDSDAATDADVALQQLPDVASSDVGSSDVVAAIDDVAVDDVSGCPGSSGAAGVPSLRPFDDPRARAFVGFGHSGAVVDGRGRIWLVGVASGCRRAGAALEPAVVRLLPDGTVDDSFGVGGRVCVSSPQAMDGSAAYLRDVTFVGERAVLVGSETVRPGALAAGLVVVLRDDGAPDPAFAQGGVFTFPDAVSWDFPLRYLTAVVADEEGITVAGEDIHPFSIGTYGVVVRLRWDGSVDRTFGEAGRVVAPEVQGIGTLLRTAWGLLVVGTTRRSAPYLLALDPRGARVPWFGVGGAAERALPQGMLLRSAVADSRGGYVVAGSWGDVTRLDTLTSAAVRFDHAGRFDASFGAGGVFVSPWLRHPSYLLNHMLARQCDGRLLLGATDRGIIGKVHRLTPDGRLDVSFGVGGTATLDLSPTPFSPTAIFVSPTDGAITTLGATGNLTLPRRFVLSP